MLDTAKLLDRIENLLLEQVHRDFSGRDSWLDLKRTDSAECLWRRYFWVDVLELEEETRVVLRGFIGEREYEQLTAEIVYEWKPCWQTVVLDCSALILSCECSWERLVLLGADLGRCAGECRLIPPDHLPPWESRPEAPPVFFPQSESEQAEDASGSELPPSPAPQNN